MTAHHGILKRLDPHGLRAEVLDPKTGRTIYDGPYDRRSYDVLCKAICERSPVDVAPLRLLTREEVEALPDGARILVRWFGGNGPWRYVAKRDRWGRVSAWLDREPSAEIGIPDPPCDQVWIDEVT